MMTNTKRDTVPFEKNEMNELIIIKPKIRDDINEYEVDEGK